MKKRLIITFISFVFCTVSMSAQNKSYVSFNEEDGLAGNSIHSIHKDKNGFIWVGTESGLSKYDGTTFMNFYKKDGLPGNRIWAITEDSQNRLYVACYLQGIAVIENDQIIKTYSLDIGAVPNSIRHLHYNKKNDVVVIGSDYGIHLLKNDSIFILDHPVKLENKLSVLDIIEYEDVIYFSALIHGDDQYRLDIDSSNIAQSKISIVKNALDPSRFTLNIIDNHLYTNVYHRVLRSPIDDLSVLDQVAETEISFLPWCSCLISDHEILYGGWGDNSFIGGLKLFNTIDYSISSFASDLDTKAVWNLYNDEQTGIIWVCTTDGLYAIPETPFEQTDISLIEGIIDINSFNDAIYILGEEGLYTLINQEINLLQTTKDIRSRLLESMTTQYPEYIISHDDLALTDREMVLHGLTVNNNELFVYSNKGSIEIASNDFGKYLPFDSENYYKVDGGKGYYYAPSYRNVRHYPDISRIKYEILSSGNQTIGDVEKIIKQKGIYYFSSSMHGVYALRDTTILVLNESNSSIDNNITGLEISPDGEIWCTSISGNLYNIGLNDSLYIKKVWNEDNSDIKGDSYKWLHFTDSTLYVGTNKFLVIVPQSELQNENISGVYSFNEHNGFPFIADKKSIFKHNNNLYYGTDKELIKINNDFLTSFKAKIIYKNIVLDQEVSSLANLDNKTLKSSTNRIQIEWSLLKYPTAKNVFYDYNINDGEEIDGNLISLNSLRPGLYTIHVRAKDLETSRLYEDIISFRINRPLIQKLWFLFILIIILVFISFITTRRIYQKINQNRIDRVKLTHTNTELRIQSLQSQMNPHFIFNSLNSIQSLILTNESDKALVYLGIFGKLIRGNLDHISEEFISVTDEVAFLNSYIEIEKMRFEDLKIRLNNRIFDRNLFIPPMLVQPLIENAIKHGISSVGKKGMITIDFDLVDDIIEVVIMDNGKGRQKKKHNPNHKSLGLKSIQKRIDLMNHKNRTEKNSIQIVDLYEDNKPSGTKVILTLMTQD